MILDTEQPRKATAKWFWKHEHNESRRFVPMPNGGSEESVRITKSVQSGVTVDVLPFFTTEPSAAVGTGAQSDISWQFFFDSDEVELFVEQLVRIDEKGDHLEATYQLFDRVDRLLSNREFAKCDKILMQASAKINRLSSFLMRSFLSITVAAKHKLTIRRAFFLQIQSRMRILRGEKADRILEGLE